MKRQLAQLVALAAILAACSSAAETAEQSPAPTPSPEPAAQAPTPDPVNAPSTNLTDGCVEAYSPDVDYFPDKVTIEEATDFEVRYEHNYKVLTVRTDLVAPGMEPQIVVMVQCGTPAPELTGELAGATLIDVPVTTFGLTRNDDLASAVALGLADNLVTHGFPNVFPEDINTRIQTGDISNNAGAFGAQDMDFEAVADKNPDVMFILLANEAGLEGVERLATLGIPTVPTLTSVSTTVLGRAEWAKVIALPFNQESRANDLLGNVFDRYRTLSAQAQAQPERPTAIFAQCGTNGECTVARAGWQAEFMEHAGLDNVIADPSAAPALDRVAIEQVFEDGAEADWLVAFSWPGEKYTGPLMPSFRAFQRNQIISNDAEGVSVREGVYEYFYSAALRPDVLLEDVVALVYPDLVPNHRLTYMGISPFPGQ